MTDSAREELLTGLVNDAMSLTLHDSDEADEGFRYQRDTLRQRFAKRLGKTVAGREEIARAIRNAMMPEANKQKHWALFYKAADAILALREPGEDAPDLDDALTDEEKSLIVQALRFAPPVPLFSEQGLGFKMLAAAEAYIADYVYDYDGATDHEPTEFERDMLSDMVNGLFGDDAFAALLSHAAGATSPPAQAAGNSDFERWAKRWHETCETMMTLLDLPGGLGPSEMLAAVQKRETATPTNRDALVEALREARQGLSYIAPAIPVLRTMFMTADLKLGMQKAEEMAVSNRAAIEKLDAVLLALSQEAPDAGVGK